MIDSFRRTVVRWLEASLRDDVYATVPSRGGGFAGADLDPEVARRAAALPGVEAVHTIRRVEIHHRMWRRRRGSISPWRRHSAAWQLH